MARRGSKPKNLRFTVRYLLSYMGKHRFLLFVAVLVSVSAISNLLGTYMIRPVVNTLTAGNTGALVRGILLTAVIYGIGVLAAYGYTQTMVRAAQKVLCDIRRDLFAHLQELPVSFFDTRRHGDIMSSFTNDVDTGHVLNNSFAVVIQSFIQIAGTLTMLFVLNWKLFFLVLICYIIMFLYIQFSGRRSSAYFARQQLSLGRPGRLYSGDGQRSEGGESI